MEQYIVSARKYRPSTFASVVGQRTLAHTLKNAIASDRLAHAYLFCGSRGVGKTSCARIFAKTINCTNRTPDGEPCNECPSCSDFNLGRSMNIVELDAASHNGIDDMKNLIEQVQVPPSTGRYRVFIIDEVHMLTTAAFNAFLKTLEEPPSYVIFILATTEKHKIIPTILSRCQIYDFNRITIADMVEHLAYVAAQEGYTAEPAALNVIARKADGAMRDALSIFDQVAASARGNITYQAAIDNLNELDTSYYNRLIDAFNAKNLPDALLIYKEVRDHGFDSLFFVTGLAQYLRDLMVAQSPATLSLLEATDDVRRQMAARAASVTPEWLYGAIDLLNEVDLNYRTSSNKQLLVELALIKLCQLLGPSPKANGEGLEPIVAQQPTIMPAAEASMSAGMTPANAASPRQTAASQTHKDSAAGTRPAAAPMHTPAPPASPRRPPAMPRLGLSLHSNKAAAGTAADDEDRTPRRANAFADADVERLWNDFIASHPTEKFLIAAMKKSLPASDDKLNYRFAVDEGFTAGAVRDHLDELLAYMRDGLQNDSFGLTYDVVISPDSPTVWTDRQVLTHMLETSEDLNALMTELKLTIE